MWYPRDGFFVRSPVRFNGVAISERERERYEQNFLRRTKSRDERARERGKETEGTVTWRRPTCRASFSRPASRSSSRPRTC